MNYQKIYNQIIERAKNRQLEGYKEKHHILPKCLGGDNKKENLVELTAREHFLCHMLLCEIYPNEIKLRQALWLMSSNPKYKNTKISSQMYEHIKSNFKHTEESKQKMRQPRPGLGEKISKAKTGKKQPNISKSKLGKPTNKKGKPDGPKHTDESKKKISEKILSKGKNRNKKIGITNSKPIEQYDLEGNLLNVFLSSTNAMVQTGIKNGSISQNLRGKSKSAGGFVWKYKK